MQNVNNYHSNLSYSYQQAFMCDYVKMQCY